MILRPGAFRTVAKWNELTQREKAAQLQIRLRGPVKVLKSLSADE